MSVIVELTIPPDCVPSGEIFASMSDVQIEIERIVPTDNGMMPFLWFWGEDDQTFIEVMKNEQEIIDITPLDRVRHGTLFRVTWHPKAAIIRAIKELRSVILDAQWTNGGWYFQIRTDRGEEISTFQATMQEAGISVHIQKIYSLTELVTGQPSVLTSKQREALTLAYHEGYYEVPAQISLSELGDRLDISSRSVSRRLRRGTAALLANSTIPSEDNRLSRKDINNVGTDPKC